MQGKRTIHAKTVNARCTEAHLTLYPSSLRSASYRQVRLTGGYDLGGAPGHLQHLPRTLTTTTFIKATKLPPPTCVQPEGSHIKPNPNTSHPRPPPPSTPTLHSRKRLCAQLFFAARDRLLRSFVACVNPNHLTGRPTNYKLRVQLYPELYSFERSLKSQPEFRHPRVWASS